MLLKRSFLAVVGVAVNVIACAPDPVSPRPLVQRGDVRLPMAVILEPSTPPGTRASKWTRLTGLQPSACPVAQMVLRQHPARFMAKPSPGH